jgi:hypothetical protein
MVGRQIDGPIDFLFPAPCFIMHQVAESSGRLPRFCLLFSFPIFAFPFFSRSFPFLSLVESLPTDTQKTVFGNAADAFQVKLLNHRPKLFLLQARLAQFPRYPPQVLKVDITLTALVEQLERT